MSIGVVPISVSEDAFDTAESADINGYVGLCTDLILCDLLAAKRYPATSQLAQLALTDVTHLKSICLSHRTQ